LAIHYGKSAPSSVLEQDPNLFTLFPNPASDHIQINSEEMIDEVIIRNVTGKTMLVNSNPSSNEAINVASLPKGLFLVECRSGDKVSTKKLMIH